MTIEEARLCEEACQAEVKTLSWQMLGTFDITAYCGCSYCCGWSTGITASGTKATEGRTISVDPNLIPLGTTVVIQFADGTTHEYIAEDTGSAIKGKIIDLYFADHAQAWNFGRQKCEVYIYN